MIFYLSCLLFWIVILVAPLTFSDQIQSTYIEYADLVHATCLSICAFGIFKASKKRGLFLLMMFYTMYANFTNLFIGEVYALHYLIETCIFLAWTIWIWARPEIHTAKTINKENVLLAFYRGDKGSVLMHLFELFGLEAKSLCIISGNKALMLKSRKETFQLVNSSLILKNKSDYIIIDTGTKSTQKFTKEMLKYSTMPVRKLGLRINCIEAVKELLALLGDKWTPTNILHNIPSVYLRKCL